METFKNSQRRQGSHSGDKSDGPWRWFRSCHGKDVLSGRAGGLWSRVGRRQGPWPPPSRQVLPPCLSGTLPRARQTGWSPRAPQPGEGGVRTLWALLTLCHPTPSPTAPLLGSPHSSGTQACSPTALGLSLSTCGMLPQLPWPLVPRTNTCTAVVPYHGPPPILFKATDIGTFPQTEPGFHFAASLRVNTYLCDFLSFLIPC